jgi:NAD-dependent SIR2 family protein deacetylase
VADDDRYFLLGNGTAPLPKKLLDDHADGKVMFLVGAGVSQNSKLKDFKGLVLQVYEKFDRKIYDILNNKDLHVKEKKEQIFSKLGDTKQAARQKAEINRFIKEDYDVVLGMIKEREKNTTNELGSRSDYLETIIEPLLSGKKPHDIHKSLIKLARRGTNKKTNKYPTAIATTNFDLLLEKAAEELGTKLESYSLGEIPTPEHPDYDDFSGIFHIHGKLNPEKPDRINKLILTDRDF